MAGDTLKQLFDDTIPILQTQESRIENGRVNNGLGLRICRKICRQLGGEISVNSIYGVGTSFKFTMKVKPAPNLNSDH